MIVNELFEARRLLAEEVGAALSVVMFTGAGLSTEAGIPDFRSPGSLWTVNKPIPFDAFRASRAARAEAWRRKFAMDDSYVGARPTIGHDAIAALARSGKVASVITQNIDGLHQVSGVPDDRLVELHGNGTYATCLDCGTRHELREVRPAFEATAEPPSCRACEGPVKSATISFGQAMPEDAMRRAAAATLACDLFVAVGSSLVVYPAAGFPSAAKSAGARLIIVNREPTPLDGEADLVLRCEIGPLFSVLLGPSDS
jgi:NAD-dependent deacetylase